MSTVYEINKGINKPLEFKGLKAQYIVYLAAGLVGLLILFAVAYVAGVPVYLGLAAIGALGYVLFSYVFRYSKKYGEHGLMKEAAFRKIPHAIRCRTRKQFFALRTPETKAEKEIQG